MAKKEKVLDLKVINGNNLDVLKNYPDNYFDAVVTDPPYGLGKEPNAEQLMRDWVDKGYHEISGKGFMGKEWDAFVPQPIFWKEVFRVLKHGGHVLAFYGTRTYDWGVMSMRFAGFEIRDCIQWLYGSGFPKGQNISKAIDKKLGKEREVVGKGTAGLTKGKMLQFSGETEYDVTAPASEEAKKYDGWNTALKPANEPIVLARKPIEKGLTIAENVMKWGTGGINIDGCRIGTDVMKGSNMQDFKDVAKKMKAEFGVGSLSFGQVSNAKTIPNTNVAIGRYPANIVLSHHDDCEDNCHDECPVKVMDEQSGKVGASRFFYISKASRTERDNGLNGFEKKNKGIYMFNGAICKDLKSNIHPTIKPVKLMRYLVKLVTPPNGKVLDPFCGSGTTGIACKLDGFQFVGIEQDKEYTAIADARVHNYTEK